jgi:hypothetical protein
MNKERALRQLSQVLRGDLPDPVDWDAVITLAAQELVAPELYARLGKHGHAGAAPPDARDFLKEIHTRNRMRNARLGETLRDVLAVLNDVRIEPVLLKGCATWASHEGRIEWSTSDRMITDLDLLVKGADIDRAAEALLGAGFAIFKDERLKSDHPAVDLGRPSDVGMVDLHARAPGPAGVDAIDTLVTRCVPVALDGLKALAPPPALQVLIGVMHDQFVDGNFWRGGFNLRHLLDVDRLADRVDWTALRSFVIAPVVRTALASQLIAAQRIAGAAVPDVFARDAWGALHYRRQRLQYTTPSVNAAFRAIGLTHKAWKPWARRRVSAL